jgi:hypothetical protein
VCFYDTIVTAFGKGAGMRNMKLAFWGSLVLLVALWLAADETVFQSMTSRALRDAMIQLTGVIAIGCQISLPA